MQMRHEGASMSINACKCYRMTHSCHHSPQPMLKLSESNWIKGTMPATMSTSGWGTNLIAWESKPYSNLQWKLCIYQIDRRQHDGIIMVIWRWGTISTYIAWAESITNRLVKRWLLVTLVDRESNRSHVLLIEFPSRRNQRTNLLMTQWSWTQMMIWWMRR